MLFGCMLYFISQSATKRRKSVGGKDSAVLSEEANVFVSVTAAVFCLAWVGSSFMGANMQLARIVLAFAALVGALGAC
jgi:hypothetical protein